MFTWCVRYRENDQTHEQQLKHGIISQYISLSLCSPTQPQMSPTTLAGIDPPDLVGVEVNIPAMEGVEGVGQHPALPIKRFAVTVVPGGENRNRNFQ